MDYLTELNRDQIRKDSLQGLLKVGATFLAVLLMCVAITIIAALIPHVAAKAAHDVQFSQFDGKF